MISGTLSGYKVYPMFDADGDAPAERLTFVESKARAVKAYESVEMNSKNEGIIVT